jgi:nucleoside 2-deoxyribosyltransferase
VDAKRADEVYGPGVIIADIVKQIVESKLIIAEITPANPNVYYEIGYAHALGKPTILIAEKATELPFDVSPFRVLFYENTIAGKKRIEDGLRRHLESILGRAV